MSNTRYMEPVVKRLFDLVKQDAPQDEQQAKQMADEAKEYIEAIQQLEQAKKAVYKKLNKKIECDVNLNDARDKEGATFLTWACKRGHALIAQALVTAKADPYKANAKGETPLAWAVTEDHVQIVQWLLEIKADPNRGGETPLICAVRHGRTQMAQRLLEAKADPHKTIANGLTPLTWAVCKRHFLIVQMLLDAKADPNRIDEKGTLLSLLANFGDVQIAQLLLGAKADVNKTDEDTGNTPLIIAAYRNHIHMVEMLLHTRASIDISNRYGDTALDYAIRYGDTALDYVIREKNLEITCLLLSHEATIKNPKKLFDFLMCYDPRDPDVLFCLNVLSQQQNNLRKLNFADATQLNDKQYQAMEQYRNQLSKVGERLGREALNSAVGDILPPPLINIICKLDAPLYHLDSSPTLFSNKEEVDKFREKLTKKQNENPPSRWNPMGWFL